MTCYPIYTCNIGGIGWVIRLANNVQEANDNVNEQQWDMLYIHNGDATGGR